MDPTDEQVARLGSPGRWVRFGIAAVVLLLASVAYRDPSFRDTWRYSIQGVALSLGFVSLYAWSGGRTVTGLLDWSVLKWLGRMSYGAYLWHIEVGAFLSKVVGIPWHETPSVMAAVSAVIFSVASFGVAALSFQLLQKPLQGLRHRLGSPVGATPQPA